jgi:hypothetical protein
MTQNESHNKTRVAVWSTLRRLMDEHPDARIVTCPDNSTEAEECELYSVFYHERRNTIELTFD